MSEGDIIANLKVKEWRLWAFAVLYFLVPISLSILAIELFGW